jgi:hypothetical protein
MPQQETKIDHVCREETLFAGIRGPIKSRDELPTRIEEVRTACGDAAIGPLTHIFRFDTPVDGFDSEIGFPVSAPVNQGNVKTHKLRRLDFFAATHHGPVSTLRETSGQVYGHMNRVGLAPELELVEIYHEFDPENEDANRIEVRGAFLAWPGIYRQQLTRVLGSELTNVIWAGGEAITPFTLVDTRADWVAQSLERLKQHATQDQQFEILSSVALVRPAEDTAKYRAIYEESGQSIQTVLDAQNEDLTSTRSGGWIDPPYCDDKVLHLSKVAYNREAYNVAKAPDELRQSYCFCSLIREAKDPKVDPIFCYRAAGWAKQFWEPILGVKFTRCDITHSILKGDRFCAWDYHLQ